MLQQKTGNIDQQRALSFCPRTDTVGIALDEQLQSDKHKIWRQTQPPRGQTNIYPSCLIL